MLPSWFINCCNHISFHPSASWDYNDLVWVSGICQNIVRKIMLSKPCRHWRSSRAQARRLWEQAYGIIPPGYHIHHKDQDYTNNNLSNLECLSARDHAYIHHPINPIPRHQRPLRIAWQKMYRTTRAISRVCLWCQRTFKSDRWNEHQTCSHTCAAFLFWHQRSGNASG